MTNMTMVKEKCAHGARADQCVNCLVQRYDRAIQEKRAPALVAQTYSPEKYSSFEAGLKRNGSWYSLDELAGEGKGQGEQKYLGSFESVAKQYLTSDAKQLKEHLKNDGRSFYDLKGIGSSDLEGAVAAVVSNGKDAVLVGCSKFEHEIKRMAESYEVSEELAARYVFDHEFVHVGQKGKYFDDDVQAKLDVERTLQEYYKSLATKTPERAAEYNQLAGIAADREQNVARNYGAHDKITSLN